MNLIQLDRPRFNPPRLSDSRGKAHNGWRICGELTPTCQKVIVSDQQVRLCEPAKCACYGDKRPAYLIVSSTDYRDIVNPLVENNLSCKIEHQYFLLTRELDAFNLAWRKHNS
jgi:hypothetical protein